MVSAQLFRRAADRMEQRYAIGMHSCCCDSIQRASLCYEYEAVEEFASYFKPDGKRIHAFWWAWPAGSLEMNARILALYLMAEILEGE